MKTSLKLSSLALTAILFSSSSFADSLPTLEKRSNESAAILEGLTNKTENTIPQSLLDKAVCIATVPNVIHVGVIFGGRYGNGLVSCRTNKGWSNPSFIKLRAGTWGAQIGVEKVDVVLIFVKKEAVEFFSRYSFTVGTDSSVAIGPVGRDSQPDTDFSARSDVYSYSLTKGVFAGLTLEGTSLAPDAYNNTLVYGSVPTNDILIRDGAKAPSVVKSYHHALTEASK